MTGMHRTIGDEVEDAVCSSTVVSDRTARNLAEWLRPEDDRDHPLAHVARGDAVTPAEVAYTVVGMIREELRYRRGVELVWLHALLLWAVSRVQLTQDDTHSVVRDATLPVSSRFTADMKAQWVSGWTADKAIRWGAEVTARPDGADDQVDRTLAEVRLCHDTVVGAMVAMVWDRDRVEVDADVVRLVAMAVEPWNEDASDALDEIDLAGWQAIVEYAVNLYTSTD